jgi:hypothetical protein
MLAAIVYNCDPESLGEMDQACFVDAFDNEVHARPEYRNLAIAVTFLPGKSEVVAFSSYDLEDDIFHEDEFRETFHRLAENARR